MTPKEPNRARLQDSIYKLAVLDLLHEAQNGVHEAMRKVLSGRDSSDAIYLAIDSLKEMQKVLREDGFVSVYEKGEK
jgi:hypothetical protein